jgi:hypothetical protein
MKQLSIPFLEKAASSDSMARIATYFDKLPRHVLSEAPWAAAFSYHPAVSFSIAYAKDCLFLQYTVEEKAVRAVANTTNGRVWEDSCVEFFVSWDAGASYYNLECNCIGTALLGYSGEQSDRQRITPELIQSIRYHVALTNTVSPNIHWEMLLVVPFSVFKYHSIQPKSGSKCRANFYKCGDLLPEPHYLAWSPIEFPKPNFHLPAFFGELVFE